MSITREEHPKYQELLELNKLIEEQQRKVDISENTALLPTETSPDWAIQEVQDDLRPGTSPEIKFDMGTRFASITDETRLSSSTFHQENLQDLNTLLKDKAKIYQQIYTDIQTPAPDLTVDDNEISNPTEPYALQYGPEDLINTYRTEHGMQTYSDEQILDYVQYANPEQYNAVMNKGSSILGEDDYSGAGFIKSFSKAGEESWNYQIISQKFFLPAMHIQMMHKWKTGDVEEDNKNWLDIMEKSEYGEWMSERELIDLKTKIENSEELSKFNVIANDLLLRGKEELQKYAKENPDLSGLTQYLEESGTFFDDDGKFVLHEHAGKASGGAFLSILGSIFSGKGAKLIKNGIIDVIQGVILYGPTPPSLKVASLYVTPWLKRKTDKLFTGLGQMAWGFNMEGASYLADAYMEMTEDKQITSEQFQRAYVEQTKRFQEYEEENGDKPSNIQIEEMLDMWADGGYQFNKDGTIIQKGIKDLDIISDALTIGLIQYTAGASAIEWIDVLWTGKGGTPVEYTMKMLRNQKHIKALK